MSSRPSLRALLPAYRSLVGEADRWLAQALEAQKAEGVQCGRGCYRCCLGLFDISAADALLVAEGYRQANPGQRQALRFRAQAQLGEIRLRAPEWPDPWRVEALTRSGSTRSVTHSPMHGASRFPMTARASSTTTGH